MQGKWTKTRKWLAGIAAAVIAGLLTWWLTEGWRRPLPPQVERSFLEKVAGKYTLHSWTEASRPITLGARITEGSLQIDSNGIADWSVIVQQTSTRDPGKVRMTARGRIQLDLQPPQIMGVTGGEFNKTDYLDNRWGQVGHDINLAVRGWDFGQPEDRFRLSLDTQADGRQIVQMKNSIGMFMWTKVRD